MLSSLKCSYIGRRLHSTSGGTGLSSPLHQSSPNVFLPNPSRPYPAAHAIIHCDLFDEAKGSRVSKFLLNLLRNPEPPWAQLHVSISPIMLALALLFNCILCVSFPLHLRPLGCTSECAGHRNSVIEVRYPMYPYNPSEYLYILLRSIQRINSAFTDLAFAVVTCYP